MFSLLPNKKFTFLIKVNKKDSWFFRFWSLWPSNEKQKMNWWDTLNINCWIQVWFWSPTDIKKRARKLENEMKKIVIYNLGNALSLQYSHGCNECRHPQIFGTSPFAPADFEAFSTMCTRWFWGPELSFIEQTAPADPKS